MYINKLVSISLKSFWSMLSICTCFPNIQEIKYLLRIFVNQFQLPLLMKEEKISIIPKPTFTTLQVFHQLRRKCIQQKPSCVCTKSMVRKETHYNAQESQQCVSTLVLGSNIKLWSSNKVETTAVILVVNSSCKI